MAILPWLRRITASPRPTALLSTALAVVLLLALPIAGPGRPRSPSPSRPARVLPAVPSINGASPILHLLFVGASITSGMEQTSLDATYPGRVVAGLQQEGLRVDWALRARWGATAADALAWPYPSDQQIIVVHLITNDFLHATPLDAFRDDLHRVLADLRGRSQRATLVCLGTWDAPGAVNPDHVPLASYDAAVRESCSSGRPLPPAGSIFADPGSRGPVGDPTPWGRTDGIHPNDLGAQRIADAVLATIAQTGDAG